MSRQERWRESREQTCALSRGSQGRADYWLILCIAPSGNHGPPPSGGAWIFLTSSSEDGA